MTVGSQAPAKEHSWDLTLPLYFHKKVSQGMMSQLEIVTKVRDKFKVGVKMRAKTLKLTKMKTHSPTLKSFQAFCSVVAVYKSEWTRLWAMTLTGSSMDPILFQNLIKTPSPAKNLTLKTTKILTISIIWRSRQTWDLQTTLNLNPKSTKSKSQIQTMKWFQQSRTYKLISAAKVAIYQICGISA